MDKATALAFAFSAGLKVRTQPAINAATTALAIHASRTVDGAPFFVRDKQLAGRAVAVLAADGRLDLALQVSLWAQDAGATAQGADAGGLARSLQAHATAKAWAQEGEGAAGPMWIRDVPRGPGEREVLAERLLLLAQASGRRRLAEAALEAALADLAHPASFTTILHAAAFAQSKSAFARTLEGLGTPHPAARGAAGQLDRLRIAISLEAERAGGAAPVDLLVRFAAKAGPGEGAVLAHLAAAAHRDGEKERALAALASARAAATAAGGAAREGLVAVLLVERALGEPSAPDPVTLPGHLRPSPTQLAAGACEAARALESGGPVLSAMRLFDPEDVGTAPSDAPSAQLVKELVREGSQAASNSGDLESLRLIYGRVRRFGLRPAWEIYMRARVADACAQLAARRRAEDAWELALDAATRGLASFERAKMRSRAACEFIRALEVPSPPRPLVDLYFAPPPPQAKPDGTD
jgi:hypothetical protein